MWTCQKCVARNWDTDGVCHNCRAPIDPEQAAAVQQRTPPTNPEPEPDPTPAPLPKQIEVIDGSFFTDGGSVHLQVRDETGAEYSVALRVSHGRRNGGWRLYFPLASPEHVEVLRLLRSASIAAPPEPAGGAPAREPGPRKMTIIGADLNELFGSMGSRKDFLRTLRDNLASKLERLYHSPSMGPFS
jgi:hypothetical protein